MTTTPHPAKPARFLSAASHEFEYRQKCSPRTSPLQWLTYGVCRVAPGGASGELFHRCEEALLFCVGGAPLVEIDGRSFSLRYYDTLYVPMGVPFHIANPAAEDGILIVCRATASQQHAPVHSVWEQVRADETRIRRLDGKDVYIMFDVGDPADKFIAGYTIYQPYTRAWPPHNHTDQEEIYIFTQGSGAIEVYAEEKSKTFVHSVQAMDAAAIPLLNYHPVFSQAEPLHFIWCLAGARYWVGDKHTQFMDASVDELTT